MIGHLCRGEKVQLGRRCLIMALKCLDGKNVIFYSFAREEMRRKDMLAQPVNTTTQCHKERDLGGSRAIRGTFRHEKIGLR